jgi:putative FmdB family regulatory protein
LPLYEYECTKCRHHFDKIENVASSVTKKCPKCGAKSERVITAPAIQFKGTGWYVTDYAGKNSDGSSKEPGDGAQNKSEKADKPDKADKSDKSEKLAAKSTESKSSSDKETSKKKK